MGIYEDFLRAMKELDSYWNPLHKELARWWKGRAEAKIEEDNGHWVARDFPGAVFWTVQAETLEIRIPPCVQGIFDLGSSKADFRVGRRK